MGVSGVLTEDELSSMLLEDGILVWECESVVNLVEDCDSRFKVGGWFEKNWLTKSHCLFVKKDTQFKWDLWGKIYWAWKLKKRAKFCCLVGRRRLQLLRDGHYILVLNKTYLMANKQQKKKWLKTSTCWREIQCWNSLQICVVENWN